MICLAWIGRTIRMPAEMGGLVALMAGMGLVMFLISLIPAILFIACMWKLFAKAAKPGWASLVPIYNTIVMIEIAGKPLWWFVLLLIPFVNVVFGMLIALVACHFGLRIQPNTQSLGEGTTTSVVVSITETLSSPTLVT